MDTTPAYGYPHRDGHGYTDSYPSAAYGYADAVREHLRSRP